MTFAHPEALALLALLPLLAFAMARRGGQAAVRVGSTSIASGIAPSRRNRLGLWLPRVLRLLAVAALIIAIARPQQGYTTTDVEASGVDIMLGVDVSSSMQAEDLGVEGVSRLDVVKSVLHDFIEARPNDRLGILAFAGDPWLVSPLTLDHDWLLQNLDRVKLGMVEDGTAIGSAIASGSARLQDTDAKSRVLVLLTDGASNAGSIQPALAAEAAAALDIKIYTVGVGSEEPRPVRITDDRGVAHMVEMSVESDALREIADMTGGQYFLASDVDALAQVYAQIDSLETTTRTIHELRHVREAFAYPALLSVALLGAELLQLLFAGLRLP